MTSEIVSQLNIELHLAKHISDLVLSSKFASLANHPNVFKIWNCGWIPFGHSTVTSQRPQKIDVASDRQVTTMMTKAKSMPSVLIVH